MAVRTKSRLQFGSLLLCAVALLTVSCRALRPPVMTDSLVMPVYYATDRKPLMPRERWEELRHANGIQVRYYGTDYEPGGLNMGICRVAVPTRKHLVGFIERPGWWGAEDPARHFSLVALAPTPTNQLFAELNQRLTNSSSRDLFIFIHGYNVTFPEAVLYTAQLAWDWDFPGGALVYSWPSNGTVLGYPRDEEAARLTERHLAQFLKQVRACAAATNVHLIAHSLGCRALTEALKALVSEPDQPLFGHIILAAPDINRFGFLQEAAQVLPHVARRVTMYVSSADRALSASESFHQFARTGELGGEPILCEGIDTIDASGVDTDLFGHSYLMNSRTVIHDMAQLICHDLPPEKRDDLERVSPWGHEYWRLIQGAHSGRKTVQ